MGLLSGCMHACMPLRQNVNRGDEYVREKWGEFLPGGAAGLKAVSVGRHTGPVCLRRQLGG